MFTASILSLISMSTLSVKPAEYCVHCAKVRVAPAYVVAEYDPKDDPGKDITDDPHGPGTHGRDPSGEVHDKRLPANDPDDYLEGDTYPQQDKD